MGLKYGTTITTMNQPLQQGSPAGYNGTDFDLLGSSPDNADAMALLTGGQAGGAQRVLAESVGFNGTTMDRIRSAADNAEKPRESVMTSLGGIGRRVAPFSPPQIRACKFPSTRLPAPRHVLWTSSRLDCSPLAPFAGLKAASNLRQRLDDLRPFLPSGASPTSAPFRVGYYPICPVARCLAASSIRFLGNPVPARASVRLAASLLAEPDPDGVTSFRTTEMRSGWVRSRPRG